MGLGAALGPVAAVCFADDHSGTQLAFSQVVGGIQAIDIQETQDVRALFTQPAGEANVNIHT